MREDHRDRGVCLLRLALHIWYATFFVSSGLLSGVSFFAGITVRAVRVPVLGFYVFVLSVDPRVYRQRIFRPRVVFVFFQV